MGCDGLAVWPRHGNFSMKNVLGICSHDQLHLDTLHFAEPSLLKRIRQLNPIASYLVFRRSTGDRVVGCVLASPCMCMMSRLCVGIPDRSARRSRVVYVYVPGTLALCRAAGVAKDRLWVPVCVQCFSSSTRAATPPKHGQHKRSQ